MRRLIKWLALTLLDLIRWCVSQWKVNGNEHTSSESEDNDSHEEEFDWGDDDGG